VESEITDKVVLKESHPIQNILPTSKIAPKIEDITDFDELD
jgi:hypothetical protein